MKKEQVLEVVEWLKNNGDSLTAHNLLKVCEDHFKLKACESKPSLKVRLASKLWGRPFEDVNKLAAFVIEFIFKELEEELINQAILMERCRSSPEFLSGYREAIKIGQKFGAEQKEEGVKTK